MGNSRAVKGRQDNLNNNNHKTSKTIDTSKRRRSLVQSVLEEACQTMCHIMRQINKEQRTLSHVFTIRSFWWHNDVKDEGEHCTALQPLTVTPTGSWVILTRLISSTWPSYQSHCMFLYKGHKLWICPFLATGLPLTLAFMYLSMEHIVERVSVAQP